MQNNQNGFSFYLDESLWFKEGQGVRELIGISLEPEITIEELEAEVRLKGTVELAGEYLPAQEGEKYDEFPSIQTARLMDRVERGEEGVHNFAHSFPVEITVPLERVSSMEDILVDIESFDYEIPDNNQLRLHAQLSINGIQQAEEEEEQEREEESFGFDESATIGPVVIDKEEDTGENTEEGEEEKEEESPIVPERDTPVVQFNDKTPQEGSIEKDQDETEGEGRFNFNKSQSFSEFFGQETTNDTVEVSPEYMEEVSSEIISEWQQSPDHKLTESPYNHSDESPASVGGIKQIFKHLFPDREDTYTQMKMYIAQEEETLASIAHKYQVSVKQLERFNGQEEDISAGQIIYIPN